MSHQLGGGFKYHGFNCKRSYVDWGHLYKEKESFYNLIGYLMSENKQDVYFYVPMIVR